MKNLSVKTLKKIRTLSILLGIVVGFIIWLFIPSYIKNNATFHVGNGKYGSKAGMLLLLPLPLFALLHRKEKREYHSTDWELQARLEEQEEKRALMLQTVVGFGESLLVIVLMLIGSTL